jgi:hypothetical protein
VVPAIGQQTFNDRDDAAYSNGFLSQVNYPSERPAVIIHEMAQITATPDYHFLYIDPNLGAEWLFDAARTYWDTFRPTVLTDFEFVRLIPKDKTVVVTVVTRRDHLDQIGVELAQVRSDAVFDPVAQDDFDQMRNVLNQRALNNLEYGGTIAPTQPVGQQVNATPGSILGGPAPTRAPGGFITQTPTPTNVPAQAAPTAPAPVPTQPDTTDPVNQPIEPTPGSLLGG